MKILAQAICSLCAIGASMPSSAADLSYPVIDTYQTECFDLQVNMAKCPEVGQPLFGQDAQYLGTQPDYQKNADGTVTDKVTGLIWAPSIDTNGDGSVRATDKMDFDQAAAYAKASRVAGKSDWRVPSIKELYSLMHFDGQDPSGLNGAGSFDLMPFIDNTVFEYTSGDTKAGERLIDSQYISSTKYVSTTLGGQETVFGVNFIDGRIKGYGLGKDDFKKTFFVLLVRDNPEYGINKFVDNKNDTITDKATALTWQKSDSQKGMGWAAALDYCEDLTLAGKSNWHLPNAKELQSIVDYKRSPDTTQSPSIDPIFNTTQVISEGGLADYPSFWTSTTHQNNGATNNGGAAAYVGFGRGLGFMGWSWTDVHGAGAQRSDPKVDDGQEYPTGHGPQGDAIHFNNYVRCVSDDSVLAVNPEHKVREKVTFTLTGNERTVMGGMSDPKVDAQGDKPMGPPPGEEGGKPMGPPPGEGDKAGGPPPMLMGDAPQYAVDACAQKAAEQVCSFPIYKTQIEGKCSELDKQMVCMPNMAKMPH